MLLRWFGVVCLWGLVGAWAAPVPLVNGDFEGGVGADGVPVGWSRYGGGGETTSLRVLAHPDGAGHGLEIRDGDGTREIGVTQRFPVEAGQGYRVTVMARVPAGATAQGAHVQLRFSPGERFVQVGVRGDPGGAVRETAVTAVAPAGSTQATVYIYTHAQPTPCVVVDRVQAETVELTAIHAEAAAMPNPEPPVYTSLKDLHLETPLVSAGAPSARLIVPSGGRYAAAAEAVVAAVAARTGVRLPVVSDDSAEAAVPLQGHAVILGNRSTNRALSALYDGFYTLLDLKYPGPGGSVVRSLHNPYGDGRNAILVGGSDDAGVAAASARLAGLIGEAPGGAGELRLGWLADIRLGEGMAVPEKASAAPIWEESRTYGSSGYFGWNVISKAMALYFMTGEERFAHEFLRLGFPDAAAIKDLEELDGERIENKHEPLAGPYHYSAHMMILFWDLIEESPLFTDEIRLRVTNAFSQQLRHRANENVYGTLTPPGFVGDRHRDWSAMSLYALSRYFQKDYRDPVWSAGLESCRVYFAALLNSPWLAGRNDHLFWYTSYYDPIVDYMILSGDRAALERGHLAEALRTQDVLFTGNDNDWGLRASSLNFLQRTAYLTGDGRWLFYRERTGIDTAGLRLGQSFWSDTLAPRPPQELVGVWTIQAMPRPFWETRDSGLALEESFLWGSFRTRLDAAGDYVLIKGHNGGGRNPHHTYALLEFRLAGRTLLKGYGTQVQTSADGMVEPVVGMDAALKAADVVGASAWAVGEVPRLPFCTWRRSLLLRQESFAVIADRFDYRTDSANLARTTLWETVGGVWSPDHEAILLHGRTDREPGPGWTLFTALSSPCTSRPSNADAPRSLIDLEAIGIRMVKATQPGDYIEQTFTLAEPFAGEVYADLLHHSDRGVVRLLLDGRQVVPECDHYAAATTLGRVPLGRQELAAGPHVLRVEAVRRREGLDRCYIGLAGVALQAPGAVARAEPVFAICPSDPGQVSGKGMVSAVWNGPVRREQRQTVFTLMAASPDLSSQPLRCRRLGAEAAVLQTPEPGLVVAGEHDGTAGEMVVVTPRGLSARGLRRVRLAGFSLEAAAPVALDWDWSSGEMAAACAAPTRLSFSAAEAVVWSGQRLEPVAGVVSVDLPAGTASLAGARLPAALLDGVRAHLDGLVTAQATAAAAAAATAAAAAAVPAAPSWSPVFSTALGQPLVGMVSAGDRVYAAAAREIVAVDAAGQTGVRMTTGGDIRSLHWWPEESLLLAGCTDETLVAFRPDGSVAWTFVSEMDRAVWEAAKQYWFKSAHPGIYGVDTGAFLEGGTQCFVGSACTLEIVDGKGALVKRLPVFWGPGWRFGIRPREDGSRDLLIARQPTDSHALAIVNSRTLTRTGSGFDGVPAGHTSMSGWATMSRNHLVIRDLDGDGTAEVVSEINGFWNRITVWNLDGQALYNAQIGPGRQIPHRNVRGLAVEDLDGDGRCEVVAALENGLVSALDCTLERRWSLRLPTPANVLEAVPVAGSTPVLVAGCDDGAVLQIDGAGAVRARGQIGAQPVAAARLTPAAGGLCVLAGADGTVAGFALGR